VSGKVKEKKKIERLGEKDKEAKRERDSGDTEQQTEAYEHTKRVKEEEKTVIVQEEKKEIAKEEKTEIAKENL
jgi:hypothetical protein